jgi:hypothetical protein
MVNAMPWTTTGDDCYHPLLGQYSGWNGMVYGDDSKWDEQQVVSQAPSMIPTSHSIGLGLWHYFCNNTAPG